MRMTKRYFLVKIVSLQPVSEDAFARALIDSVRRYFGETGLCRIDPRLIRFDEKAAKAVVACRKEGADEMQAAIGFLSDVSGVAVAPIAVRVSGTIKGLGTSR
jgi:RNase P/RNase MRP subunit POP5